MGQVKYEKYQTTGKIKYLNFKIRVTYAIISLTKRIKVD